MSSRISVKRKGRRIGDNIKEALRRERKTQQWLADQIGVSKQHVNKWCTNKNKPNSKYLRDIAEALDYQVQELITGNFHEDMKRIAEEPMEEYFDILEEEKRSISDMLDILTDDPNLTDKQRQAYKKSILNKIDLIVNIVT